MKLRKIRKVLGILLLCTVLLTVAVAVSYAWFINNSEVNLATDGNVHLTVDNRLQIRAYSPNNTPDSGWGAGYTTAIEGSYPDITGDGEHFYFPTALDLDDQPFYDQPSETFIYLNERMDQHLFYITLKVEFRSHTPMNVYLAQGSSVLGVDMEKHDDLTETVSSDLIAGAVRMGFYELTKDGEGNPVEILKTVWIPNDTYHLIDNGDGTYGYDIGGENTEIYGYLAPDNGTLKDSAYMKECTWSEEDYTSGAVLVGDGMLATPADGSGPSDPNGSPILLSLDGHDTKVLIIRIWVEGTDNEAVSTLNGGRIKYDMNFVGIIPTETENTPAEPEG